MSRRDRQLSWIHAVGAVPVAAIVWVVLAGALTFALADMALGGMIAIGIIAAVGCVLLMLPAPGARGSGLGSIVTMLPCAIGLALSLM